MTLRYARRARIMCFAALLATVLSPTRRGAADVPRNGAEPRYVVFQLMGLEDFRTLAEQVPFKQRLLRLVGELKETFGTSNASRLVGFTPGLLRVQNLPENELEARVGVALDVSESTSMPVFFHLDDMHFCYNRTDLFGDGAAAEWSAFPNPGETHGPIVERYWLNWGRWVVFPAPIPCFESPEFREDVAQRLKSRVAEPIVTRLDVWRSQGREHLLAGIAVGNETQVPDYRGLKDGREEHIVGLDFTEHPPRKVRMESHEMARAGYSALSLRGHTQMSIENEAKQQGRDVEEVISDLLEEVAADYAAFRCRILYDAGVPREKVFTHFTSPFREKIVRARESHPEFFGTAGGSNLPPRVSCAVNDYSRPGFTVARDSVDLRSLTAEIDEARRSTNPDRTWALVESYATTGQPGRPQTRQEYEAYLGGLFANGAILVNVYGWNVPRENPFAIAHDGGVVRAIQDWLRGDRLPTDWTNATAAVAPPQAVQTIQDKMARLQQVVRQWKETGRDLSSLVGVMQEFEPLMKAGKLKEAEAVLDRALELLTNETIRQPDAGHREKPSGLATGDGPDTARQLSLGHGQARTTFNFARSFAADEPGRLHAVWQTTHDGRSQVFYRRSLNDGKTWETPKRLSEDEASHEHPSIAVSGDDVFVVWHWFRSANMPVVCLRRSSDGGRNWDDVRTVCDSGTAAHASLAVVRKTVHLIWKDHRAGDTEVYYRRSADGGQTFEAERRLTDAPVISYVPSLAASDQVVVLAWVDTRDGNEEEYIKVSMDGGTTWGPDTRMTDNRMNSWAPSVAVDDRTIHLVWFGQKDAPFHLYDAEAKLDEALRLVGLEPESPPAGVHIPDPEQIAKLRATEKMKKIQAESPRWLTAGGDREKLQRIMKEFEEMGQPVGLLAKAEKALDKALVLIGAGLAAPEKEDTMTVDAIQRRMQAKVRKVEQHGPRWAAQGGDPQELQAAMRQFEQAIERAGHTGSYVNKERKLDEALKLMNISFTPNLPDTLPVKHYGEVMPLRVKAKQQNLRAAAPQWIQRGGSQEQLETLLEEFHRRAEIAQLEWDIYYRRSDDAGKTWSDEQRLVGVPGISHRPHLAVSGREVHLVWWDNRQGNNEIYYKHSADGGRTWGHDIRLTMTAAASQFPMVAATRSGPHLIWTELRDGGSQVFYKRPRQ